MSEPVARTPARRGPPSVIAKFRSIERARKAVARLNVHGIALDDIALVGAVGAGSGHRSGPARRRHRRHSPAGVFDVPVSPAGSVWLAVFDDSPDAAEILAACEPLELRATESSDQFRIES